MKIVDQEGSLALAEVLSRPLFAHLATYSSAGPRDSPVWFLWEDGAMWVIANLDLDSFPRRIQENPECAMGVVDFDPISGRVHHIGFRGRATVEPWCDARARRKLRRYLGEDESRWDPDLFTLDATRKRLAFVRFEPETAVVRDQSYRSALSDRDA